PKLLTHDRWRRCNRLFLRQKMGIRPAAASRGSSATGRRGSGFRLLLGFDLAQLADGDLQEAGVFVDGLVLMLPAIVAATIGGTRLIDGATAIGAEELARVELRLDALAAPRLLDDVLRLEFLLRQFEMLGQAPDVVLADFDIARHTAAQAGAADAVEAI